MACVLDASAVLCLLFSEKGADKVEAVSVMPASRSSTTAKFCPSSSIAVSMPRRRSKTWRSRHHVLPVGQEVAEEAARLRALSKEAGLSLGDRFCLALARSLGVPALTTDRAWKDIAKPAG